MLLFKGNFFFKGDGKSFQFVEMPLCEPKADPELSTKLMSKKRFTCMAFGPFHQHFLSKPYHYKRILIILMIESGLQIWVIETFIWIERLGPTYLSGNWLQWLMRIFDKTRINLNCVRVNRIIKKVWPVQSSSNFSSNSVELD